METTGNKKLNTLQIERVCSPHHEAMLAALKLVLDLPRVPVNLCETK
jgi:hypothetical protein